MLGHLAHRQNEQVAQSGGLRMQVAIALPSASGTRLATTGAERRSA